MTVFDINLNIGNIPTKATAAKSRALPPTAKSYFQMPFNKTLKV